MTLAPPHPTTTFGARIIDMRCSATTAQPGISGDDLDANRCQLLAGHGGEHALMYASTACRQVLAWRADGAPHPSETDWRGLPWMRGYPVPAWFETGSVDA
ncbi:hypothetical protein SAMN05443575_0728 [Jatrophihabitans endophyticus]|uniref:Uncharacterized protein n=1 Tax=Jatrophihabitans endophyticus TaxID=1206085 RepID=A0A1M5DYG6_9ACTN|nr:hypothetical protein [Jatrophihabitans endophyticus]SHF71881.1 hypothetical protein SAMN05443575_0728 [Jatrophihabitans endophyticus]